MIKERFFKKFSCNLLVIYQEQEQASQRKMSMWLDPLAGQEVSAERMKLAEVQFEAMQTTFNNIMETCRKKCIPRDEGFSESDLTKGEMTCVDRCVAKMHYSNRVIGAYVQTQRFSPERQLPHYEKFYPK